MGAATREPFEAARNALPKAIQQACDKTTRAFAAYWAGCAAGEIKGYEYEKKSPAYDAMKMALSLVDLGRDSDGNKLPPLERVDELTPEQRNVIIVLSEDEIPLETGWSRIQKGAAWRRRWLGIEPPSIVDEPDASGRPRYQSKKPLDGVPADRHVELAVEGLRGCYPGYWQKLLLEVLPKTAHLAGAYAARILPTLGHESPFFVDTMVAGLFLALARSKTPIPEDADRLFPIARNMQLPTAHEWLVECAAALPPGRREAAVIGAMQRSDGRANDVLEGVLAILATDPMPPVIDAALAFAKKAKKTRDSHVKSKVIIAERQLAAMKKGSSSAPKKPRNEIVLRVESIVHPTSLADLDAARVKQLRVAGDLWEGTRRPPERRLGTDENDEASFGGVCQWRVLADDTHRYDAWLFAGDSGAYFIEGTTTRIAEMIQRSVSVLREKDVDTGLAEALSRASSAAAKVEGPAKPAAKKAAAKKAAAKTAAPTKKKSAPATKPAKKKR